MLMCPHECDCDCHQKVIKRYGMEGGRPDSESLIEVPKTQHVRPCCDGPCPICRRPIKEGMTKQHLMSKCHEKSEADADDLLRLRDRSYPTAL